MPYSFWEILASFEKDPLTKSPALQSAEIGQKRLIPFPQHVSMEAWKTIKNTYT